MSGRPTIVLVHGLAIVEPARRMMVGVPEYLESRGFRTTRTYVQGDGSLEELTARLVPQLHAIDGELALLCHSMGGLQARHALLDDALASRIRAIATVGTPHAGSPLAVVGRMGSRAYRDLTPAARAAWQERHGQAESESIRRHGVRRLSAVARLARAARSPLAFTQAALRFIEGPSDGLVSADSQAWGDVVCEVDLDHRQCVMFGVRGRQRDEALGLWGKLAEAACTEQGTAAPSAPLPRPLPPAPSPSGKG